MTKRKLNAIIAIVFVLIYLGTGYIAFTSCRSDVITNFSIPFNYSDVDDFTLEADEKYENIDNLVEQGMIDSVSVGKYPYALALYDEEGKLICSGGYNIVYNDKAIFIDDYLTYEHVLKIKKTFKNLDCCTIFSMKYNEINGEIVPTTIILCDINDGLTLELVLNKSKGEEKTVYSGVTYFSDKLPEDGLCAYLYFDVGKLQRCSKVSFDLQKSLLSRVREELSSDTVESLHNGRYGGGAIRDNSEIENEGIFEFQGKAYYYYTIVAINPNYETLVSPLFREKIIFQTVFFLMMAIAIFVFANVYYSKNKKLNESRQAFTSAAAHELKTPLAVIQNQCECVIENVAPEKNNEYIRSIYTESIRMNKLVATLLQYNRLASATKIAKQPCRLDKIVQAEAEKYNSLAESKGISLNYYAEKSKDIALNEDLISLVIDNFLSNAVKHGNGNIIVHAASCSNGYRVSIFNEGEPIADKYKNNLWEVFYRADKARTKNDDNFSGMGLAICKQILTLHGFKYGFENKTNGVEFYFIAK